MQFCGWDALVKQPCNRVRESKTSLAVFLETLSQHGWKCEHPGRRNTAAGTDGKRYLCVWCDGLLFDVPRSVYLSVDCGRVLLIGESVDLSFDECLAMLGMDEDPALAQPVASAETNRQKSLFE